MFLDDRLCHRDALLIGLREKMPYAGLGKGLGEHLQLAGKGMSRPPLKV